ncbi:hypothetical protein [Streptosporangium sp. NPDC000509]
MAPEREGPENEPLSPEAAEWVAAPADQVI